MGSASFPLAFRRRDSLRGSLVASVLFHVALAVICIVWVALGVRRGPGWGTHFQEGSAIHVNMVPTLPGVPLPRPMLETPNRVHVENPGLYQAPPQPLTPPPPDAVQIPKFKNLEKPLPPVRTKEKPTVILQRERQLLVNKRIQKQRMTPPENAVPTGAGGAPLINYGQKMVTANGSGVIGTNSPFGSLYGWYVEAVRNRISSNWLLSIINPQILSARRVYIEFDILRDGTITHVQLTQPSGVPEVDRSAERAVLASSPLAPLPAGYKENSVHVEFYFDFHR
ncbi:MAG: TonB family protein [Acidobacteriota bacterium]|nr:TonB family protein [Acidobacteriota bacterium]